MQPNHEIPLESGEASEENAGRKIQTSVEKIKLLVLYYLARCLRLL